VVRIVRRAAARYELAARDPHAYARKWHSP
jgi:hypothetical protein